MHNMRSMITSHQIVVAMPLLQYPRLFVLWNVFDIDSVYVGLFNSTQWMIFVKYLKTKNTWWKTRQPGVTFVGVFEYKSIPPWQSPKLANGKWRWVTDPPKLKCSVRLSSPDGGVRHVARAFHQDLYLSWLVYQRTSCHSKAIRW